jgi:hypothetical protein
MHKIKHKNKLKITKVYKVCKMGKNTKKVGMKLRKFIDFF